MKRIELDEGKYTVEFNEDTGRAWFHTQGAATFISEHKPVIALVQEVERLRAVAAEVNSWIVCAGSGLTSLAGDLMQNAERIESITRAKGYAMPEDEQADEALAMNVEHGLTVTPAGVALGGGRMLTDGIVQGRGGSIVTVRHGKIVKVERKQP